MKLNLLIPLLISFFLSSCDSNSQQHSADSNQNSSTKNGVENKKDQEKNSFNTTEFNRGSTYSRLKQKIQNEDTISIHVMIPLCDNESQGIIPVPEHLGDGSDPESNLYWGAMYGFKGYFKRSNWKLIDTQKNIDSNIIERVVFKKSLPSSSTVLIVADAYKGDHMHECLEDYLNALAGKKMETHNLKNQSINIFSRADLLIFNGHNGLMDYEMDLVASNDSVIRETAVIGCQSYEYFRSHFLAAHGYPILTTTNLMAPEAYVAEGLIDAWLQLSSEAEIRSAVGKAYNDYQKCGIQGATRLFQCGW